MTLYPADWIKYLKFVSYDLDISLTFGGGQSSKLFAQCGGIFGQKWEYWSKIRILVKNRKFCQKPKKKLVKNRNFDQTS